MTYTAENLFNDRTELLKLVAKAYKCSVINADKVIHIFHNGKPIHEFTKEEIIYFRGAIEEYFAKEIKEKLA